MRMLAKCLAVAAVLALEVAAGVADLPADSAASSASQEEPAKAPEKPGPDWVVYIVSGVVVAAGASFWGWRRGRRAAKR